MSGPLELQCMKFSLLKFRIVTWEMMKCFTLWTKEADWANLQDLSILISYSESCWRYVIPQTYSHAVLGWRSKIQTYICWLGKKFVSVVWRRGASKEKRHYWFTIHCSCGGRWTSRIHQISKYSRICACGWWWWWKKMMTLPLQQLWTFFQSWSPFDLYFSWSLNNLSLQYWLLLLICQYPNELNEIRIIIKSPICCWNSNATGKLFSRDKPLIGRNYWSFFFWSVYLC